MTDRPAAEPPRGTAGKRALGAMESAVRRVRELQGTGSARSSPAPETAETAEKGSPSPAPSSPARPTPAPSTPAAPAPVTPVQADAGVSEERGRPDRWLIVAVTVAAVLVVLAAAALAAALTGGSSPTTAPAPVGPARAAPSVGRHAAGGAHAPPAPEPSTSTSTTTTTTTPAGPAPSAGGPPVISGLNPASGTPGQGIVVAGANFLSPDGRIVASFNGQVAPTSCPTQNSCTVTVPPPAGSSTAQVTITTATGTSNAVTFQYS